MGKLRTDSARIRAQRATLDQEDRPTLVHCPACDGVGKRMQELPRGRYRYGPCPWCAGIGATTTRMVAAFRRILRIVHVARMKGRPCLKSSASGSI